LLRLPQQAPNGTAKNTPYTPNGKKSGSNGKIPAGSQQQYQQSIPPYPIAPLFDHTCTPIRQSFWNFHLTKRLSVVYNEKAQEVRFLPSVACSTSYDHSAEIQNDFLQESGDFFHARL